MNTNTTALRVFRLADGRRVKEVPETDGCKGCMFDIGSTRECAAPSDRDLDGCWGSVIFQPADHEPVAVAEPVQREPLTDEQIYALMPPADGTAEVNVVRLEVLPGVMGTEFDEVDAWSRALVVQTARAIERAHGIGQQDKGADHA